MSLVQVDSIEGRSGTTITIPAGQTLAVAGTFTTSGTVTVTAGGIGTTELADDAVTAAKIADDAVVAAAIGDDAVGADQLASSAVVTASIVDANVTLAKIENLAANTVLVRDANSSGVASAKAVADTQILIGDGTGFTAAALSGDATMANTGAVTIANNAITNVKVADDAIGLAELSATGTPGSGNYLRGDNTWATVTEGLATFSQWRLSQDHTGAVDPIPSSHLEEVDAPVGFGKLGSSMTQSSGVFTFPSTGYWLVKFHVLFIGSTSSLHNKFKIQTTIDHSTGPTWATACESSGSVGATNQEQGQTTEYIFDVTSTAECKVKFSIGPFSNNGTAAKGDTNVNETFFTFIKLADT